MTIRLKDYGRNQKKRKEYIKQSGLLLAGVDVSKAKLRRLELGTVLGTSFGFTVSRGRSTSTNVLIKM